MSKSKDYDYTFKIVLIGNTCVGKSCLLVRFADDIFTESYVTTIGVDFRYKTMLFNEQVAKIQIWDTAGQERYRSITTAYYRGATAIVICFDLTNRESFIKLDNWLSEIKKNCDEDIVKIVFANKSDLIEERVIGKEEILEFQSKTGIIIREVSAKNGDKVENAFKELIEVLIDNKVNKKRKNGYLLGDGSGGRKSCC